MQGTNLFKKLNAVSEVHAKVDKSPLNSFSLVFFLLKHEHVVVEELLKLLVGEINAQLFERVKLCTKKQVSLTRLKLMLSKHDVKRFPPQRFQSRRCRAHRQSSFEADWFPR